MRIVKRLLKTGVIVLGLLALVFLFFVIIPESETVPSLKARTDTQYWQMSRGFKIAYNYYHGAADSTKPPIIFLHGGPGAFVQSGTIDFFKRVTEFGYDIYLYDQAGSGLSDRLPRYSDITFDTHIQDLHEIVTRQIRAQKVVLVGQSFGAILAAHFAATYPELVERIIFTSPGQLQPDLTEPGDTLGLAAKYPTPDSLHYRDPYNFVSDVNWAAVSPKAIVATTGALLFDRKLVSDEQMDRFLNRLMSKVTRGGVCDTTKPMPMEGGMGLYAYIGTNNYSQLRDVRDAIRKLDIPVLVIQGECDFIPYACAYEYVDLFQNSRFAFIKGAGHVIWWEQPDAYLEVLRGFLVN